MGQISQTATEAGRLNCQSTPDGHRALAIVRAPALLGLLSAVFAVSGCNCGTSVPNVDADLPDARIEILDAPECNSNEDCDDGLFCNGTEVCVLTACVRTPTDCDDGIACTTDSCSEDARACTHSVPDLDRDGYADGTCVDDRGMPLGNDCDDTDAARFPGNLEVCDDEGHDEDCDLDTRGNVDADGDGFEDIRCCNPMMAGSSTPNCGLDCDDGRRSTNPGGTEVCNFLNDDCDATTDEGVSITVYQDADRDGYGVESLAMEACNDTAGYAPGFGDCDDTRIDRSPGQPEFCDTIDNDCNGMVDDMTREVSWYRDADGDGFGTPGPETRLSCEPLTAMGFSLLDSDCDDTSRSISPVAAELCNGVDDDCNRGADFRIGADDYEDDDADGVVDLACGAPFGEDCDDRNPATGPGSSEICDGRDNDCDMDVDEGATSAVFYRDEDMDGYGSTTAGTIVGCAVMAGYVAVGGDCDDMDAARQPGATETCDGEDDDCNGAVDDGVTLAPLPRATAGCVSGMPAIVRCDPNFENCNGTVADGCEVDLTTDSANCRFCGNACTSVGGETRACVAGDCRITSCPPTQRDCNGSPTDGCERMIGTTSDCSDCNDRCALAHVTRQACTAGACTFNRATDCERGWADCDMNPATGCEQALDTMSDCASCGDACDAMTEYCDVSRHSCQPSSSGCTAPQADCDMNGSCETNTATSVTSCGSCGRACSGSNATWSCSSGACSVASCTGGFRDCDGLAMNGCEASPTSITACGASCQVCVVANGTPACTGGACTIASCSPGWSDCNGNPADGCETNLSTDAANCGFCTNNCSNEANVAVGVCAASTCSPAVCDAGFANCSAAPGCETSTDTDASNCGVCGRVCGTGGACESGLCDEIIQVANGQYHTCALRSSGTVVCWGENGSGQLGIGSTTDQLTPVVVPSLSGVVAVVAGWEHTCALLSSGRVRCWGGNSQGQVGDTTTTNRTSPTPVESDSTMLELDRVTRIAAGRYATCALRTSGTLECWGQNSGDMIESAGSATYPSAHPRSISFGKGEERIGMFAVGGSFIVVRAGGTIYSVGDHPGDHTTDFQDLSELWSWGDDIVELVAGNDHVCVRYLSGAVECAGGNTNGQLADGTTTNSPTGVWPRVGVGTLFTAATTLVAYDDTTCARNALGHVYCMGANGEAQCTGPGSPPVLSPRRVNVASGGAAFVSRLFANGGGGAYRTPCLVSNAGAVFCWGNNIGGSIGNGSTVGQEYPTRVVGLTP